MHKMSGIVFGGGSRCAGGTVTLGAAHAVSPGPTCRDARMAR